jgi:hypothetical protein
MNRFESFPQCARCLLSLAKESPAVAELQDARLRSQVEASAVRIIRESEEKNLTSPQAGNLILREVRRLTSKDDPYGPIKAEEMARARDVFSNLGHEAGGDLRRRVELAALGNSFDFFHKPEEAMREVPEAIRKGIAFQRDDVDRFGELLQEKVRLAVYLTDNAGEIYFDLPLYEYIRDRSERIVLVVKRGPSLNDLTRVELKEAELEGRFCEIADTGTDGVGIDWDHVSESFRALVSQSDLIVSKGMANFETLYAWEMTAPVFFIFKAKCRPIRDFLHAPPESFMALLKPGRTS